MYVVEDAGLSHDDHGGINNIVTITFVLWWLSVLLSVLDDDTNDEDDDVTFFFFMASLDTIRAMMLATSLRSKSCRYCRNYG